MGSWGPGGQTRTLLHPCSGVQVPKWTFLRLGSPGASFSICPNHRDRWRARSAGNTTYGVLGQSSRCPPLLAQTLLATRSSCHASSFSAQQPYPSPWGVPSRGPRPGLLRCGRAGGGRGLAGVSTLPAEGALSELERRRGSWSPSWAGGDGPGRRGCRGAAPLLTTQLPAPHPRRPARRRPRPAPGAPNSGNF